MILDLFRKLISVKLRPFSDESRPLANRLWPSGYVDLQEAGSSKKSSQFAAKAGFERGLLIKVAARASLLSRAQVEEVHLLIRKFHPDVLFDVYLVETTGDKDLTTSLKTLEKTDFFTKEVDQLLIDGTCRIAIHSAKDLPEPLCAGLTIVALTEGVDSSDVLVLRDGEALGTLPRGARIGTSCARREKTIRELRADLQPVDIRGPVDKRLAKLDTGEVDGVVMAEAALIRLKLTHRHRIRLSGDVAPYQGRLAIVARADDGAMIDLFRCVNAAHTLLNERS